MPVVIANEFLGAIQDLDGVELGVARFDDTLVPTGAGGDVDSLTGEGTMTRLTFDAAWDASGLVLEIAEADQWPVAADGAGDQVNWAVVYVAQAGHAKEGRMVVAIPYTEHTAAASWTFRPSAGIARPTAGATFEARLAALEALEALPDPADGSPGQAVVLGGDGSYRLMTLTGTAPDPTEGTPGQVWTSDGTVGSWEDPTGGGGNVFVYNSSGTQSGNRFNDWSDLLSAITASEVPVDVYLEQDETAPLGSHDLGTSRWFGNGEDAWLGGVSLTLPAGASISAWTSPYIGAGLALLNEDDTMMEVTEAGGIIVDRGAILATYDAPMFDVTAGVLWGIALFHSGRVLSGPEPLLTNGVTDPDYGNYEILKLSHASALGAVVLHGTRSIITADPIVRGTVGTAVIVSDDAAAGRTTWTNPNFSGTDAGFLNNVQGSNIAVDASGFSGNLSPTDTDVQAALATLDGLTLGGGSGDVVGPSSSVDGRFALFDGTTGKLLKQSASAPGDAAYKDTGTTAGTLAAGDDSRITGAGPRRIPHQPLVDDLWLGPPGVSNAPSVAASTLSSSLGNALTYLSPCPIWVPETCQVDAIAVYQSGAGTDVGLTGELGYGPVATWPWTGTLEFSAGTFDATATAGLRTLTFSPRTITAGLHWGFLKVACSTSAGTNPQFIRWTDPLAMYPFAGVAPSSSAPTNTQPYGTSLSATGGIPTNLAAVTNAFGNGSRYVWIGLRVSV